MDKVWIIWFDQVLNKRARFHLHETQNPIYMFKNYIAAKGYFLINICPMRLNIYYTLVYTIKQNNVDT